MAPLANPGQIRTGLVTLGCKITIQKIHFSHRLKKGWDFPRHPHLVKTVFPQVCSSTLNITLSLQHRRHRCKLLSSEGCDAVFPTYENSVSFTMQYTTVALVFNMDSGLFWSITNEEEESKLSTHEDIKFLSPSLTNTSGYQMEPGLPWNQEIKP